MTELELIEAISTGQTITAYVEVDLLRGTYRGQVRVLAAALEGDYVIGIDDYDRGALEANVQFAQLSDLEVTS